MSELRPSSRALLQRARASFSPSEDDRARMDRALSVELGIALGASSVAPAAIPGASAGGASAGGAAAAGSGTGAAGVGTTIGVAKWAGAIALTCAVGAAGAVSIGSRSHESVSTVTATTATAITASPSAHAPPIEVAPPPVQEAAPIETAAPSEPAPAARPSPHVGPRRVAVAPPSPPPRAAEPSTPNAVAEETRMLREANVALQAGDASRALGLLDTHGRSFPNGVLSEERSAQRVFVLCKLGRVAEARAEAARFAKASPDSPLAPRVRASCAGEP